MTTKAILRAAVAWLAAGIGLGATVAQTRVVDPAFAPALLDDEPANQSVILEPLADGSTLAIATATSSKFTHVNGTATAELTRLRPDGTVDPAFARNFSRPVMAAVPLAGGRILAVTLPNGGTPGTRFDRLLADGTVDPAYTPVNFGASTFVYRVIATPDGGALASGYFPISDTRAQSLVRFNADGTFDASFDDSAASIAVSLNAGLAFAGTADHRVYYNRSMPVRDSNNNVIATAYLLARLNADGSADPTFAGPLAAAIDPNASSTSGHAGFSALAVQTDGRILAGAGTKLVRLKTDGTVDATFAAAIPNLQQVDSIALLSDGRIVVQAHVTPTPLPVSATPLPTDYTGAPLTTFGVFVLNQSGQLVRDLRSALPDTNAAELLGVQPDDRLLIRHGRPAIASYFYWSVPVGAIAVASAFQPVSPGVSLYGAKLARIDVSGTLEAAYAPAFMRRATPAVLKVAADSAGRLLVAGAFTSIDSVARGGLARLLANGTVDPNYQPAPRANTGLSVGFVYPDGRTILQEQALGLPDSYGVYSVTTAYERIAADGTTDPTFNGSGIPSNDAVINAVDAAGNLIVSGYDSATYTEENMKLFRLRPDGSRTATLATAFAGLPVYATPAGPISLSATGDAVPVPTTPVPGGPGSDGPSTVILDNAPMNCVTGVQVQSDGKLLIGTTAKTVNNVAVAGVARLNPDGTTDPSYQPAFTLGPGEWNIDVSLLPGGRAIVSASNGAKVDAVRMLSTGAIDPTFSILQKSAIFRVFELSDGSLLDPTGASHWLASGLPDLGYSLELDNSPASAAEIEGAIYLGGFFGTIDGVARTGLARLVPANTAGITQQPKSVHTTEGGTAIFQVGLGTPATATYQWYFNGTAISGATSPSLVLNYVSTAAAGTYTVQVTTGGQTYTSDPATLTVTPAKARLVNFSARSRVSADHPPQIGGFVLLGSNPRPVLLRAVGGGLQAALPGAELLPSPTLQLYTGDQAIAENTGGIMASEIVAIANRVGAFAPAQPGGGLAAGSALVVTLPAGPHTAHTVASDGRPGISLFEVYDAGTDTAAALGNFSIRSYAAGGDNVAIAGFVIAGDRPLKVLIRGVGPGMVAYGVTDAVADPRITLYAGAQAIARNDNWGTPTGDAANAGAIAAVAAKVGAYALADGSTDAALLVTLDPGAYTIIGSGAPNTSGEILIEVYAVDPQ